MNCDVCNIHLEEDNTYESILCKPCMISKEKFHCSKCKCELKLHKSYLKLRETINRQRRLLLAILFFVMADGILSIFKPMLGLEIVVGFVGSILLTNSLVFALFLIVPWAFYLGVWALKALGHKRIKYDANEIPESLIFGAWATGISMYILPFVLYFFGTFLLKLLKVIP